MLWLGLAHGVELADIKAWRAARPGVAGGDAAEGDLAVMKCLARKAANHTHLRQYRAAEELYGLAREVAAALGCAQYEAALQADMEKIGSLDRGVAAPPQVAVS